MTNNKDDIKYIKRCFELARKGEGKVSPNPLVGAVIVKEGKVVSEGWHEKYGAPHAEAMSISKSNVPLKNAVLYCNLEPCCHKNKQTPPCTPLIISSGIKRVVISNYDPNPFVSGKGINELKKAGIEVTTGVLEKEGNYLNRFFFKKIITNLPYVTIKIAQSLDGKITSQLNKQTQITGKKSAEFVHQQRAVYDAILIGANTIKIDNPALDVRFEKGRNPIRIILDSNLISPIESKVFTANDKEKTWLVTSENSNKTRISHFKKKEIEIIELNTDKKGNFNIESLLSYLSSRKINSVLVEGGAEIFSNFISSGLFDDIIVLQAPVFFGTGLNSVELNKQVELEIKSIEKLGKDLKIVLNKKLSE